MANKYWAAGVSGNWNDILSWSDFAIGTPAGAVVPGAGDAAIFNAASGTVTATLDISPDIQTLTMTGFTGTLAFGTNTISLNSTGTIFTGATTMAVTGTPQIICTNSSATSRTITPGAVTEANSISFRFTAGTGSLTVATGAYRDLDFTDGINPTGFAGAFSNNVQTVYGNFKASTGMTRVAGGSALTFASTSGTKTITTAAVVFDCPFTFNGVGGTWQLQDALTSGDTRTCTLVNGTLDFNDYTLTTGLFSSSNSNTRVLAFGTGKIVVTGTNATVYNTSVATGLTVTGTRTVEFTGVGTGGQTRTITGGVTTTGGTAATAVDCYIQAGADAIDFGTANRTYRTIDFTGFGSGAIAANTRPNIYGDFVLSATMTVTGGTNNWVFAATTAQTITTNSVTINNPITFNGVGGTWVLQDALTLDSTQTLTLTNGTLDLNDYTLTTGIFSSNNSNARTLAFFNTGAIFCTSASTTADVTVFNTSTSTNFTVTGTSKQVIISGAPTSFVRSVLTGLVSSGGTEANAVNVYVYNGSDTINLGTSNSVFLDLQLGFGGFTGNLAANVAPIIYANFSFSGGGTIPGGANAWTFKSTTSGNSVSSTAVINNPIIFDGVGGEWDIANGPVVNEAVTLTNGTLKIATAFPFTVGSFVTSGTNQKFLKSQVPGTQATISDASGTNSVSYLTIQDSNATGGANWYANGPTNVDAGNNTGWIFFPTPADSNEITMRLRSFTQPRRF
jgi:hypothetical protein